MLGKNKKCGIRFNTNLVFHSPAKVQQASCISLANQALGIGLAEAREPSSHVACSQSHFVCQHSKSSHRNKA
jgi:hypothetical protein